MSFKREDSGPAAALEPEVGKQATVVTDRLGQQVYVRGEGPVERAARELDQWLKKAVCIYTDKPETLLKCGRFCLIESPMSNVLNSTHPLG